MGRKKPVGPRRGRGRPTKLYGSKDITKCCVPNCGVSKRNDKVVEHQALLVVFDTNGKPVSEDHAGFENLTEAQKSHTLYFRSVGATDEKYPENVFIKSSKSIPGQGSITNFLNKQRGSPHTGRVTAMEVDLEDSDGDPDDPGPGIGVDDGLNFVSEQEDGRQEPPEDHEINLTLGGDTGAACHSTVSVHTEDHLHFGSENLEESPGNDNSHPTVEGNEGESGPRPFPLDSLSLPSDDEYDHNHNNNANDSHSEIEDVDEQENEVRGEEDDEGEDKRVEVGSLCQAVQSAFATKSQIKDAGGLIELFAKVVWREKDKMENRKKITEELESFFVPCEDDDNFMKCEPCVNYITTSNIPNHLRKHHKGKNGFGIIKAIRNRNTASQNNFQQMKKHVAIPLHKWAVKEYGAFKKLNKKHEEESMEAAKNVVRNALLCLKDPEKSSFDFVKLNDLDIIKGLKGATINDGRQQFFMLRDLVFDKLSVKIAETMKSTHIIGATLDKVTMNKIPYTVVLTYYFDDSGKIKWLLNDIYPNKSTDGCGEDVAK